MIFVKEKARKVSKGKKDAISYKMQLDCILCTAESDNVSLHMLYVRVRYGILPFFAVTHKKALEKV